LQVALASRIEAYASTFAGVGTPDVDQAVAPPKVTIIYGQCLVGEQDCARAER